MDIPCFIYNSDEPKSGFVHEYLSQCKTITMHAAVRNIKTKTDEQLIRLKKLGINDLYVGIESGLDDVLVDVRKGHTVNDAVIQLNRLNHAGIRHCMMLMRDWQEKAEELKAELRLPN